MTCDYHVTTCMTCNYHVTSCITCDCHVTSLQPVEGTEYVVMECIVLEGGDDVQLEPGEVVTLVRVEGGGASLRVRTTDVHQTEGTLPATFLRRKTSTNGDDMEGNYSNCVPPLSYSLAPSLLSLSLTLLCTPSLISFLS